MDWSQKAFWDKATKYVQLGLKENFLQHPLFAYWCIMALEPLAKAAVSYFDPVLLVDLKNKDVAGVLYASENNLHEKLQSIGISGGLEAFGIKVDEEAHTLNISVVFERLLVLTRKQFGPEQQGICKNLTMLRNEEVHTGRSVFDHISLEDWLPDYYRVTKILIECQGKEVNEYWGSPETHNLIEQIVKDLDETLLQEVLADIAKYKSMFESKPIELQEAIKYHFILWNSLPYIRVNCPACSYKNAIAEGNSSYHSITPVSAEYYIENDIILPNHFKCERCGLELYGNERLRAAGNGLGDPFTNRIGVSEDDFEPPNPEED